MILTDSLGCSLIVHYRRGHVFRKENMVATQENPEGKPKRTPAPDETYSLSNDIFFFSNGYSLRGVKDVLALVKCEDSSDKPFGVKWLTKTGSDVKWFTDISKRDADFTKLTNAIREANNITKKGGISKMFKTIKEYFEAHRDILMSIAIAILVDHFFFEGAFTERIKGLVSGLINRAEKKLEV